jgi:Caspase domain
MTRSIYALLVGIDSYPAPVASLRGCVNDIVAIEAYLRGRVAQDGFELHVHTLKDQAATRQAVIDGFRQHLGQASNQDVAFF